MAFFNNQLKQVLRRLGRTPMFTAITLITLAAGVGGEHGGFQRPRRRPTETIAVSRPEGAAGGLAHRSCYQRHGPRRLDVNGLNESSGSERESL